MSNAYDFTQADPAQQPTTVVNVAAPEPPQAPTPGMATRSEVASFLAGGSAGPSPLSRPAKTSDLPPHSWWSDPEKADMSRGIVKGLSRSALGLASWIPGTGDLFTEKGYLGKRAYAPTQSAGEGFGVALSTLAPFGAAGRAVNAIRLGPQAIDRIRNISPALGTAARDIFGTASATPGTWINPGRLIATRATLPRVQAAKSVVAGTVGGAAQATPGDSSYPAKLENAAIGGVTGLATGVGLPLAGRGARQAIQWLNSLPSTQRTAAGAAAAALVGGGAYNMGFSHPLIEAAAAFFLIRSGLGVTLAHHLAPQVAQLAAHIHATSPTVAGAAGAGAAALANEASPQGGLR